MDAPYAEHDAGSPPADPDVVVPDDDELDRLLRPQRPDPRTLIVTWFRGLSPRARWLTVGVVAAAVGLALLSGLLGDSGSSAVVLPMTKADDVPSVGSRAASGAPAGPAPTTAASALTVHVAGAVSAPGIVRLPLGARVADALAAAGGLRGDADSDRLNLAETLSDGVRLYVPAIGQAVLPQPVSAGGVHLGGGGGGVDGEPSTPAAPLDLNSATAEQLDSLPGVGPSTAAAIIGYRDSHGPFRSVDELDEVRGIGPAKLEQLRELVVVS